MYHEQLARVARIKADACADHDLVLRLREAAILHERKARQMKRQGQYAGQHQGLSAQANLG
jgi:hypothetical protein